eukprot:842011-Alexandrium_andersonii.AAC.1
MGSDCASPRRSMAVLKTFQHLIHASTLGGPGSSCLTQVPEVTLKEKAMWLSFRSARLPCGPKSAKSTYGSEPERMSWSTADSCSQVGSISSEG